MPLFEYVCSDCHARFEELVRSPASPVACPECGSSRAEKQLSVFATPSGAGGEGAESCPLARAGVCGQPGGCRARA